MLTHHDPRAFRDADEWRRQFAAAAVHVQWDTDRSLRGAALPYNAIQVGVSRHVIRAYVEEWVKHIEDYTPLVRKVYALVRSGNERKAKDLLPREKVYPVDDALARRIGMS